MVKLVELVNKVLFGELNFHDIIEIAGKLKVEVMSVLHIITEHIVRAFTIGISIEQCMRT